MTQQTTKQVKIDPSYVDAGSTGTVASGDNLTTTIEKVTNQIKQSEIFSIAMSIALG